MQIGRLVSLKEVEGVLSHFAEDKRLGPDGWPIEFFTTFFDIMGSDLLDVVEISRTQGYMSVAINSTFISLIPKSDNPESFLDFRPISLSNLVYKLVTNIITNRIKPNCQRYCPKSNLFFLLLINNL